MTQFYTDPSRAYDPHALPDAEAFQVTKTDPITSEMMLEPGWYFWACFPGCLPDSEPTGPYDSEGDAIFAAQDRDKTAPGRWLWTAPGEIVDHEGFTVARGLRGTDARAIVREHNAIVDAAADRTAWLERMLAGGQGFGAR